MVFYVIFIRYCGAMGYGPGQSVMHMNYIYLHRVCTTTQYYHTEHSVAFYIQFCGHVQVVQSARISSIRRACYNYNADTLHA